MSAQIPKLRLAGNIQPICVPENAAQESPSFVVGCKGETLICSNFGTDISEKLATGLHCADGSGPVADSMCMKQEVIRKHARLNT